MPLDWIAGLPVARRVEKDVDVARLLMLTITGRRITRGVTGVLESDLADRMVRGRRVPVLKRAAHELRRRRERAGVDQRLQMLLVDVPVADVEDDGAEGEEHGQKQRQEHDDLTALVATSSAAAPVAPFPPHRPPQDALALRIVHRCRRNVNPRMRPRRPRIQIGRDEAERPFGLDPPSWCRARAAPKASLPRAMTRMGGNHPSPAHSPYACGRVMQGSITSCERTAAGCVVCAIRSRIHSTFRIREADSF